MVDPYASIRNCESSSTLPSAATKALHEELSAKPMVEAAPQQQPRKPPTAAAAAAATTTTTVGKKKTRRKNKAGSRARHHLYSIVRDVNAMENLRRRCRYQNFRRPINHGDSGDDSHVENAVDGGFIGTDAITSTLSLERCLVPYALEHWKVVANERCGSWYVVPSMLSEQRGNDLDPKDKHGVDQDQAENIENSDTTKNSREPSQFVIEQQQCRPRPPPNCYFKSTDGHVNVWDFSLKRLNLSLIENVVARDGGCLLVDSSVRKVLPDSMSRTIPIWAAVLNRIVLRYSSSIESTNKHHEDNRFWDTNLYTPRGIISEEEHETITNLLEERVETLFRCGAIVNPSKLVQQLTKPLRVFWMNYEGKLYPANDTLMGDDSRNSNPPREQYKDISATNSGTELDRLLEKYFVILCWNPSRYRLALEKSDNRLGIPGTKVEKHQTEWVPITSRTNSQEKEDSRQTRQQLPTPSIPGYFYTPGAADDHESWARHLTPALFWDNRELLLESELCSDEHSGNNDRNNDDDRIDALIDVLVHQSAGNSELLTSQRDGGDVSHITTEPVVYSYSDRIGQTNLWIGSRRAGRPPECWSGFDAVLNVTHHEYDGLFETNDGTAAAVVSQKNTCDRPHFYLQLPVEEGKRDRTKLELWMPVGLVFLIQHLQAGRRVLVHCNQGRDRSVAIALVFVVVACPLVFPLKPKPDFRDRKWDLSSLGESTKNCNDFEGDDATKEPPDAGTPLETFYRWSGVPKAIVSKLLETGGRELFLLWVHEQLGHEEIRRLADKEGVRIALHLIRQDRDVAEPSRSTMQKINRFLMSSSIYR